MSSQDFVGEDFRQLTSNFPPTGFVPNGWSWLDSANGSAAAVQSENIQCLSLDVSGCCNLRCLYCAEAATQPTRPPMSGQTLTDALDFFKTHSHSGGSLVIRLTCGEPLLNLPLLFQLQEQLDTWERPVSVWLTSNGTRIDRTMAAWLAEKKWRVKISLDGPAALHDANRSFADGKGSYDAVLAALDYLLEFLPDSLSVSAVLRHGMDPHEVVGHIASLGVQQIDLVPIAHRHIRFGLTFDDLKMYERFLHDWVQKLVAVGVQKLPKLIQLEKSVRRLLVGVVPLVGCDAGRSLLAVDPAGAFYPCHRFIGFKAYRLGDLASGLRAEVIDDFCRSLGRPSIERLECSACWAVSVCGGPCFANTMCFGLGGDHPFGAHCAYWRTTIYQGFLLLHALKVAAPRELFCFFRDSIGYRRSS